MKKNRARLLAAIVVGSFVFLTVWLGWFPSLELSLQDSLYQQSGPVNPAIKIIAIDEKTLDALGQFETWTREPYARLIEALNTEDFAPVVIGFDLLLVNEKGSGDDSLVEACRAHSNVVLASNLVFSERLESAGEGYRVNTLHVEMAELPFEPLNRYVQTGFVNAVLDSRDGRIRYCLLEKDGYHSFDSVIARAAGAETIPADGILLDYTAGPESYEILSMIDVLEGRIPAAAFHNSIVLVGIYAPGMGDAYPVPVDRGSQMYGVEIHANIIQGLLEGRWLVEADPLLNALGYGIAAFLLTLSSAWLPLWGCAAAALLVLAGQYLLCLWAEGAGILLAILGLPLGVLGAAAWAIVEKYASEALQKRKIVRAFRKYVAPQVVEEISRNHDYQLKLGGEKRQIAVLFVDIRGFTPLCEALEPEQVMEILNEYLDLVTKSIFRNGGTLDKFIGDAAMAIFNAPFDSQDYIYHAVCAARDIAAGSEKIAESFQGRFGKTISYGIGINCGEAIVGNVGSDFRMEYTAIGDTVNTAARLESNARPGQILISESVYEALKERIQASAVGEVALKGKEQKLMVYQVDGV